MLMRKTRRSVLPELIFVHTAHTSWEHLEVKWVSKTPEEKHRVEATGLPKDPSDYLFGCHQQSSLHPQESEGDDIQSTVLLTQSENRALLGRPSSEEAGLEECGKAPSQQSVVTNVLGVLIMKRGILFLM